VDIFTTGPDVEPVSVINQREFHLRWAESLKQPRA
jgi:hypothetical protein